MSVVASPARLDRTPPDRARPVRVGGTPPWPARRPARRGGRARRVVVPVLAGVLAAVGVVAARAAGMLEGPAGLAAAVVLVLLVPTSRELARRVLYAGCLLLGWVPVLWWYELPVGQAGRVTVGLAALAAVVAAFAVARPRRLLPRVRVVDALLPVTVLLGCWALWPWLMVRTTRETMGLLLTGWDNVAHFSMVHSIRLHGVTVDSLGGSWQFANYPEGFHAAVAAVQELLMGPAVRSLPTELEAYPRCVAIVVLAATLTVAAGLAALPPLRRRPALAIPMITLAATVFVLGPGATSVENGFGNFVVACALVCAVALVAVPMPRVAPLPVAVLSGAAVGIATCWVLLLLPAVPALLAALLPVRRSRFRTTPAAAAIMIVTVVGAGACLARTAVILSRVESDALLTPGGVAPPGLGDVVIAALALVVAALAARRRPRLMMLALVPVVGVAVTVAMARAQIDAVGTISYYALKYATALYTLLPVLLLVPVAYLLWRRVPRGNWAVAGGLVVALAATQAFGLAIPDATSIGLPPAAPGALDRATHLRNLDINPSTADLADRVAAVDGPPEHAYYLDVPTDGKTHPALAGQWYLALTDTWTAAANKIAGGTYLGRPPADDPVVLAAAETVFAADPNAVVLVRPGYVPTLAAALVNPSLSRRVRGL